MRTASLAKLTAVVVIAALGAAWVASAGGSTAARYRTATASDQAVEQVLVTVGTIEPVSQASVAFPVAGSVADVAVAVGAEVAAGAPLAQLDLDDLMTARNSAQASLDQARLVLQLALDGEDPTVATGGTPAGGGFGRPVATPSAAVAAARQAVVDASAAVGDALAAAEAATTNAEAVCSVVDSESGSDAEPEADPVACSDALAASLAAQQELLAAQRELVSAIDDLTELLEQLAGETSTTVTTTSTTPVAPGGSSPSAPSGATGTAPDGATGAGSVLSASDGPSALDLVFYQEAVDAAEVAVAVADQALAQAEIVSPIAGTVVDVGISPGDTVEAGSATQSIVVVGEGGFEVSTSVSVTDLPDLEVGQPASVVPDGGDASIEGEIVAIGLAPATDTSTTYSVTIALTGDTSGLGNGSTASVAITTAAAEDALAVPTSAVSIDGSAATVVRLVDGAPEVTEVSIGAIGSTWTEVTEGVDLGDEVVLAEIDAPLPGSATDTSTGGTTGGGFPGGGSFPGGGFAGSGRPGGG
jgi:HlyD family secretion protein